MTRLFGYRKGQAWEYLAVFMAISAIWTNWFFRDLLHGVVGPLIATCLVMVLAAFAWRGLFDRSNVLSISTDGVWFRAWTTSSLLPWSEVKAVKQVSAPKGEPFISLLLKDEESLLKQPEFSGMRHQAESWRNFGCSPFTLRVTLLDTTTGETLALLNQYLSADHLASNQVQTPPDIATHTSG
jgi:hypothetical protein